MTETSSLPVEERIERPPEIDDGALQRIWLIRPVEKAASPIIDHNLELINAANQLKRWYQGKIINTPRELLSTLLDPNLNNATTMLTNFFDTVKRFVPGAFPAHCDAVRELEFTTMRLIRTLMEIIDAPVFIEALRRVSNLFASLADQTNFMLSDHDLRQRINSRLRQLLESFGEISNVFHARERERDLEIAFRKLPPVTAEDVKNAAEEAVNEVTAKMRITAADVKDHTTAETAAAVAEVKKTVRKAKRAIIKNHNTARESEADLRTPKGERARQIAAVRTMLKNAATDGKNMTVLTACKKVWKPVKGGYPTQNALYQYCHAHLEN